METEVMKRVKRRGLKMDDWATRRRSFSREEIVEQQFERPLTPLRLPPLHKSGTVCEGKQIISQKPSGAFQRIHFSFFLLPLPFSVSLALPQDRHYCSLHATCWLRPPFKVDKPGGGEGTCVNHPANDRCPSEAEGRNNAGGTPRRLSFSLLLPVSFHVGPDSFLN